MGKPTRGQVRARSGVTVVLFSANATLGYVPICNVAIETAMERVGLRQWREVLVNGELLGVQPLRAEEKRATHGRVPIAVTITLEELQRYVGLYGPSRKPGDATDVATRKVQLWPYLRNIERGLRVMGLEQIPENDWCIRAEY